MINDETRSISLDIDPGSTATYQCKVTIEHNIMTGIEVEYDGPVINIEKNCKLLPNSISQYMTYPRFSSI